MTPPAMKSIQASELPFAVQRSSVRTDGIYVEERGDGSVERVGFWRDGSLQVAVVLGDNRAWIETRRYFEASDDVEADAVAQFQQWLDGVAWRDLRLHAAGTFTCAFCEKTQQEVSKLIMGPHVGICNECVALCSEIVNDSPSLEPNK